MAIKIVRQFYVNFREKIKKLARKWNGINSVIRLENKSVPPEIIDNWTPSSYRSKSPDWSEMGAGYNSQGKWVEGYKGQAILMNQKIPDKIKKTNNKDYTGEENEVNQNVNEESTIIHTLGNENYIRNSIIQLNDVSHKFIGQSEGLEKVVIKEKGREISTDLSKLKLESKNIDLQQKFDKDNGVKAYNQLEKNPDDIYNNQQLLKYPYQTSALNVKNEEVKESDVLTYNINKNYALDESEIVKYEDIEEIDNVLNKIETCLSRRNNWFDSFGRCQLTCQVNCQHTCQISCQACNRKQCHDQKCGMH